MSSEPLRKQFLRVGGKRMAFHQRGEGPAIVFLHGNPISSYLWRNVLPYVAGQGRCIAPDLIGMGDSEKLDRPGRDSYRFVEHRRYLDGLIEQLDLGDKVTLVVHDWGGPLGFDWARRNPDRVAGIAYMETLGRSLTLRDWPMALPAWTGMAAMRTPLGEQLMLRNNAFVEVGLRAGMSRRLTPEEFAEYRRPFAEPGEDRRPILTWPRQIPIGGHPPDVHRVVAACGEWMAANTVPKLFFDAEPGAILVGGPRDFCRRWPNQTEVKVRGLHYVQEDNPRRSAERYRAG